MSPIRYNKSNFSISVAVFLAVVFAIAIPVATVAQYYNFGNPAATDNSATLSTDNLSSSYPTTSNPTPSFPQFPEFQQPTITSNQTYANSGTTGERQYAGLPVGQQDARQVGQAVMTTTQPSLSQQPNQAATQQPNQASQQTQVTVFNQPRLTQPNEVGVPAYQPTQSVAPSNAIPIIPAPMDVPTFDPTGDNIVNFDTPAFQTPQFTVPSTTSPNGDNPPLLAMGGVGNAYTPSGGPGQTGGTVPAFRTPGVQESPTGQGLAARERQRQDNRKQADQEYIDAWKEIRDKNNTKAWLTPLPPYSGPLENRNIGREEEDSPVLQASFLSHTIKQDDYEYDWEREEKHYFSLSMLDPTRFGERVKAWIGLGPNEDKARKHMEDGLQLMENGKNTKAAQEFEWAAYYAPETPLEEDARYHAAECYYRDKRFDKAVNQYTKLLTSFPSSPYKSEAIKNTFEIARTWIKQVTEDKVGYVNMYDKSRPTFDTFGHADRALKTIFINCPNDPMADDSVFLLAHGYMRLGRTQGDINFEHAAEYFKQLRDCYPNSEFVVEAMRLEVICREKSGLGADYDMRQIIEAGKIAEQTRKQYGTRMPSDVRNELIETENRLNEQKAQKLWITGKFYDDRYDYGAARLTYLELINTYPTTVYADKARKRYEQIRDLPDELPNDWQRIKSVFRIKWQ